VYGMAFSDDESGEGLFRDAEAALGARLDLGAGLVALAFGGAMMRSYLDEFISETVVKSS
jgi:hypothetical protein